MKLRMISGAAVLFFLFLPGSLLQAENPGNDDIMIMLAIQNDIKNMDTPLDNFITHSIYLEFLLSDFEVFIAEPGDNLNLTSLKNRKQFSYLVNALYSYNSDKVELSINCYRIKDGFSWQASGLSSFIGLELEKDLEEHTQSIIKIIEQDLMDHPDMLYLLPEEAVVETIAASSNELPDITTEAAMFFPLGESLNYLDRGIVGRIRYQYIWDNPSIDFALGWLLSINTVTARGKLNRADNYFVSTGPDIHLKYHINQRLYISLGTAGGICFWSINLENQGYQGTVIPMASSDLGMGVDLSDNVSLFLSGEYSIYLEESLYIMGISPSLGVYINL